MAKKKSKEELDIDDSLDLNDEVQAAISFLTHLL